MLRVIGIDVGLSGAIAVLDEDGQCLLCCDTPIAMRQDSQGRDRRGYALSDMRRLLVDIPTPRLAAVEAVHAFPEQGASSTFELGRGFGLWCGMLAALQIPFMLVQPVRWKAHFGLLRQGKEAARLAGQQLWPNVDLSKKKHDGRADALHIAEYARRTQHNTVGSTTKGETHGERSTPAA